MTASLLAAIKGADGAGDPENVDVGDLLPLADRDARAPRKVVVTKDETTIVDGTGDAAQIAGRAGRIRDDTENPDSGYDREKLQERLGKCPRSTSITCTCDRAHPSAAACSASQYCNRVDSVRSCTGAAVDWRTAASRSRRQG